MVEEERRTWEKFTLSGFSLHKRY